MIRKLLLTLALLAFHQAASAVVCVVTEHRDLPRDANGQVMQVPNFPPVATQSVDFTASEATANAFSGGTYYIGIICDAKAHFEVDVEASATATATHPWVPADTWFFIEVPPGYEIAFYDGTT